MARKQIDPAKKEKIIKALSKGKAPVEIARKHKISAGYIYKLRGILNAEQSKAAVVETPSVVEAPVVQEPSAVEEINAQIHLRESEIATLRDTLNILKK